MAQAAPGDPGPPVPAPPVPGMPMMPMMPWLPGMPPGQNPFGPPGQVMQMATLPLPGGGVMHNPFFNIPPGQWGRVTPNPADLTVQLPGGAVANPIWDSTQNAWGYLMDGQFLRLPIQFPAPPPAG